MYSYYGPYIPSEDSLKGFPNPRTGLGLRCSKPEEGSNVLFGIVKGGLGFRVRGFWHAIPKPYYVRKLSQRALAPM